MRGGLFLLIALLALTGPARADVFVPADPPAASGDCLVGAGDVLVGRSLGGLQLSAGGGAFEPLEGVVGCPTVAAADDGTLAIIGSEEEPAHMVVGRVGAFSAPIPLDSRAGGASVAAARGGWAAAAWLVREGRSTAVTLLVVAPDGRRTRTIIERTRSDFVSAPQVVIGPAGDATVLWSRSARRSTRLRLARVSAGGAPVIRDLPGVPGPQFAGTPHALAVAPGGAALLAWVAKDGVRALEGAGQPALVSRSVDASAVTAAVNDAGAALVGHVNSAGEVVLVDRAAGGTWSVPRVLDDIAADPGISGVYDSPPIRGGAVTADGRAVMVWSDTREARMSVTAATGRPGGPWSSPVTLSAITRDAFGPTVSLDAGGEPRVLWSEDGVGTHGARLAPAASDVTPPVVDARLPTRIRLPSAGRFRLAVPVRCSEACDVRLSVRGTGEVRALPAGGTATLRFRSPIALAHELRRRPSSRRLRIRLLATDRAGNVVRISRVVRVAAR